jgi:NADH dehydrogenase
MTRRPARGESGFGASGSAGGVEAEKPTVVILGAGFAGLAAAKALRRARVRVRIIDRANHHLFQPLLYQVATAALNPSDIAAPIRRIVRHHASTDVLLADVVGIDLPSRHVELADERIAFDYLVVATGATHSYFGRDAWAARAPGLKSVEDALDIRRRVLLAFEVAEREPDAGRRRAWMTFVIVGAGPTGVELAGTLAEVARKTLARDFRHIKPSEARVILLEGGERVLPAFPPDLSESARRQLNRLGVEVHTGAQVTDIDEFAVWIGDVSIEARTILWAAGVAASPVGRMLGAPLDRAGRVVVNPDLSCPGAPGVFVAGDLCRVEQDGSLVPGVAPAAMQEGRAAARNILRMIRGLPTEKFRYHDKGSLATIGRAAAVAQIGKAKLTGFLAWLLWLFVHIFFLIGFRNRVLVLFEWAWSYLTYDRGARLITHRAQGPLLGDFRRATQAMNVSRIAPGDAETSLPQTSKPSAS